jgi:hypothetical protein
MSDDLVSKLERLSPVAADRDAMLIAVGRASAPRVQPWRWAVGGLVLVQLLTCGAWWHSTRAKPEPVLGPPMMEPDARSYIVLRKQSLDDLWPTRDWPDTEPVRPLTRRDWDIE